MAVVTIRQLLDSGVHFGHQTRRWNPKVKRFILTERSGIHIIDLQQSLSYIDKAYEFVKETVAHGGTVLFVGTKKQAQEVLAEQATRVGQPYVNQRWLGGLLTNFQTVSKRLARMKELEELDYENPAESGFTKKELLLKKRELDKLHKSLGGIRNLTKTPSALWVVDAKREHLAVNEATEARHPRDRHPRHERRPGRVPVPDPRQRRRDPLGGPAHPHHRRRRRRGPHPASPADRRVGRRRAPGRLGARAARAGRARQRSRRTCRRPPPKRLRMPPAPPLHGEVDRRRRGPVRRGCRSRRGSRRRGRDADATADAAEAAAADVVPTDAAGASASDR